jgi:tryptophanyl-tRNA synthetase
MTQTATTKRPTVLSGIQPSGHLTLGNYLGALKHWLDLHAQFDCYYMLVDLHAVTVRQDPAALRERCHEFLALYIASGLDPEQNVLFVQSHVPAHAELAWLLNCYTQMGELNRMTQFKDKSAKHADNINAGLFGYPVLMAADILLYQAERVPVGDDQKQHLELTRDIAHRVNRLYGTPEAPIFTVPEPMIPPVGARIMGLQNPTAKMSKSGDADTDAVYLLDPPAAITRKIKRAVTDTDTAIRFDVANKPGVSNLLGMLAALSGEPIAALEARFEGRGYGHLKGEVAERTVALLEPLQQRYHEVRAAPDYLQQVLRRGAEQAAARAAPTLARLQDAIGFLPR